MGDAAGAPGEVVTVDVSLVGRGASISIVSGTLTFDPAVLEAVECRAGAAAQAAQKDVSTSEGGPGELIFVVFGLNDNVIADGVLMECDFRIVEGAGAGETQVGGTADGSTPEAESVEMGLVAGTVSVAISLPELVVGDAAGAPGEVVTVDVSLVGRGASISIVSGTLTFDPAVLEAVECSGGGCGAGGAEGREHVGGWSRGADLRGFRAQRQRDCGRGIDGVRFSGSWRERERERRR
ncbi:MAG: hypothetical protein KatS3mg076_1660 [Candidatus Binatia bacterium]|nr:MAG: hypothetical protein KatS3mg076_1660 [Candidatus Binatia bacterium]